MVLVWFALIQDLNPDPHLDLDLDLYWSKDKLHSPLSLELTILRSDLMNTEAEFKEFEPRLKYGWFHLKLY